MLHMLMTWRLRFSHVVGILPLLAVALGGLVFWAVRRWRASVRDVLVASGVSDEWPVEVPQAAQGGEPPLQIPSQGYGPLFHRRYRVDIANPQVAPQALMKRIKANVQEFCPATLAEFTKTKGHPSELRVGDEYSIRLLSPWDGVVRVVDVQDDSFAFMTLEGHPEAGQIRFRMAASPARPRALRFEILSWARSRDQMVDLGYRTGKVGSMVQKGAWVEFCRRVQQASGGRRIGKIEVLTEEREFTGEVVPHAEPSTVGAVS